MITRRTILFTAATIALLGQAHADDASDATSLPSGKFELKPFMMEDVNGTIVDREALQGKFALVFFGYTSCPDVCPTALASISAALQKLTAAEADRLLPLFVTVDPDRDTRKVLSQYVQAFDPRVIAVRGPKEYTDRMAEIFGVTYKKVVADPAKPDDYAVDHTAAIFFLDPDGVLIRTFGHQIGPDELVAGLREAFKVRPAN